jgi:hypothetical protein
MRTDPLSSNDLDILGIFGLMAKGLAPPGPKYGPRVRPEADALVAESAKVRPPRRGLLDRLDDWLWRQQQRSVDAYLAKSTDVYDLEARIRAMERSSPYPYY